MTKKNFDLTAMQREDLMMAYRDVARACHKQEEAYEKVARHPAKRYYVSAKQAFEKLRKMVTGDFSEVDSMEEPRRRLYYNLFEKLNEMSQRKEYIGKSLYFICSFLVIEPAPEFFITPCRVRDIFCKYRKYGRDFREDFRKAKSSGKDCA